MSETLFVVALTVICSAVAYASSLLLIKSRMLSRKLSTLIGGFVPTMIILSALIVAHIMWLSRHASGYSPLVFVIYGFWLIMLNLFFNLAAAGHATRSR
ncbi:MAG TPA: hypothetical protein VF409_11600 [Sphingomonas sp.]